MNIFNANAMDNVQFNSGIKRSDWDYLYTSIVEKIESFERPQDKHDFILSLYSASIKNPTSNGKVTDQIVMNRLVYPYLEAAMIHYGIGNKVIMSFANGQVNLSEFRASTWSHPDQDGNLVEFNDVFAYQAHHAKFSPIVHTNATTPAPVRRMKAEF